MGKKLDQAIFMNFHTQNQGKFKTMTKVSLTFDLRKRSPSWIKKKKKTPLVPFTNFTIQGILIYHLLNQICHMQLWPGWQAEGESEKCLAATQPVRGAGQRLGSRGRWGLSALEKSLLNFFYFYMFVTWLSSSTNRGYIFYELKWKSLLFFWLLSPFLPSKTVSGWRKTTRETKGGKKSA